LTALKGPEIKNKKALELGEAGRKSIGIRGRSGDACEDSSCNREDNTTWEEEERKTNRGQTGNGVTSKETAFEAGAIKKRKSTGHWEVFIAELKVTGRPL